LKFNLISDNPYVLKIENVFSKKINKEILDEAVRLKKHFKNATISDNKTIKNNKINKTFRNNLSIYYDEYYNQNRGKSVLLNNIDIFLRNIDLMSIIRSSNPSIRVLLNSNYHESQVSRYGDDGQKYLWHIDNDNTTRRLVTFVYYFNVEPKKYQGGEIVFSSSPITDGLNANNILNKDMPQVKAIPENNVGYIFDSFTAHTVLPTTSSKTFNHGRFSLNCWIGINHQ
jgi:Rps23 Pro-64 3,4-dihydroxylase Tpa1-like proline 4-hydroxylase